MIFKSLLLVFSIFVFGNAQIPYDRILQKDELSNYFKPDIIKENATHDAVVKFLKLQLKGRFYFDWSDFNNLFTNYQQIYSKEQKKHQKLSDYHSSRFPAKAQWYLPYSNLLGEKVTAYELRHLARQQKSKDMALIHFYQNKKTDHIKYFTDQVASLNKAFFDGKYDDEGNGVYESYRAGRRIHNWLFCHAAYMSDSNYTIDRQSLLIRTFLHHGAYLFEQLPIYKPGNHHTKGLVALFEISTIFNDFVETEKWQAHALKGILEHMRREINLDGFQFERSVHYHKGDIENYFRVYQLAKRTQIQLPEEFTQALKKMFEAMVSLAQPNKRLPVLQDDTDAPFTENNKMSGIFFLATALFENPEYAYFAAKKPPVSFYWLMNLSEVKPGKFKKKKPDISSTELTQTGYYIMRGGWDKSSLQMVFSAGLSDIKPDHQHGDMLGVTAFGLGTELLANYQVAYKNPDYSFWKNSWVKNVALVDSQLQGWEWKPNRGGSGFGKWGKLPEPVVKAWIKNKEFDYIAASHDGFNNLAVEYQREVLFIKDNYWLITDKFSSDKAHLYQQVWQGNYEINSETEVSRSVGNKGTFFISQLEKKPYKIKQSHFREKQNLVFSTEQNGDFSFNTLLYPVENSEGRLAELFVTENSNEFFNADTKKILKAKDFYVLLDVTKIITQEFDLQFLSECKVLLKNTDDAIQLTLIYPTEITFIKKDKNSGVSIEDGWKPGELKIFNFR